MEHKMSIKFLEKSENDNGCTYVLVKFFDREWIFCCWFFGISKI